ncbi:hypothetical protein LCGC14_1129070 [marine sediment metagenome]|uniref:Uncharacterized protein n=1 Tax=marine sediment metagenome TaxID=412755 RepID=A0A0F9PJY0_9ZZZZ|nr:hypothetical protein [Methylophaga sp.]
MITLRQILGYGPTSMLKHGPPDNLADATEYINQGTELDQENAQAIIAAITLMEVVIIAAPNDGEAIVEHLTKFLERHK